jgi:glycosyltransferase involved in cell wall biosynthesis
VPGLPLVSVITPTHQRHQLLLERCIPSVQAQDYAGPVEHIIVSGPDPVLRDLLASHLYETADGEALRYHEIDPDVADGGATPRRAGCEIARGDLIAYLDDDCSYRPDHVSVLEAAISRENAEFAFSVMQTWHGGSPAHTVGSPPPMYGAIDTSIIMNRAGLLAKATWEKVWDYRDGRPPDPDGDLVNRWMLLGVPWAFAGEVTVDYWHGEPGGSRA